MKKRKILLVFLVCVLTGITACKQPMVVTEPDEKEEIEHTPIESEEIMVESKEYGTEKVSLEGKKLENLTAVGKDDAFYCNQEENIKPEYGMDITPVLVCKDPVYDITYYVNYGRDYYIYAYRNETSELAVAIPARDLFCREGELYFIADTYGRYQFSGFAHGNILKYNPKDGSVAVVVECSADGMMVYQDGICYRQVEEKKETGEVTSRKEECFFFSFVTGESSLFPKKFGKLRRWNGYLLQVEKEIVEVSESDPIVQYAIDLGYTVAGVGGAVAAINLVDVQGTVKESLKNVKHFPDTYWIGGDFVYYVAQQKQEAEKESRDVLRRYDMRNGNYKDVAVLDYPTSLLTSDMLIYNEIVYFGNGLRVDLNSGEQCYMQNADGTSAQPKYFYTDGENIFCMSNGKLWLFEEQQGVPKGVQEFVAGVPIEIGTYVYRFSEP